MMTCLRLFSTSKLSPNVCLNLDKERWKTLKNRFCQFRGWDVDTGVPARTKLEELGMKDIADKLHSAGK